mmetsp:Transcript_5826/g.12126  ORF Transcript_5826/g.12126 Transcript_5826/m.12126 type:complete len:1034 (+) Transcript_5826:79-3180(+)
MADSYAYNEPSDDEMEESGGGVAYAAPTYIPQKEFRHAEDEDDDEDDDEDEEPPIVVKPQLQPRGKPEAMSASIMAHIAHTEGEDDDDDSVVVDAMEEEDDVPSAIAMAVPVDAAAAVAAVPVFTPPVAVVAKKPLAKKKASSPRKRPATKPAAKKKKPPPKAARSDSPEVENFLEQEAERITSDEYEALAQLMNQFCRVPLLAEFSRPVKLLHPELAANYSKIISHPVDLGLVCRGIRRRAYKTTRDVRLDMWRVFANCVKFHSHPSNKEKVPSFVSIALHLREYFNSLWQEYMLPSELPPKPSAGLQQAMSKRAEERIRRLENSGVLMMSKKFLTRVARLLGKFIEDGGRVDVLDKEPLFGDRFTADREVMEVSRNVRELQQELLDMVGRDEEYSIDDFTKRLNACFTKDGVLDDNQALRNRIRNRLDRLVGKLSVPLHEANSRGVTQSSIWGNIATTIWARESGKKAYWPALCLGILPPSEQREGWHAAVTERNEARLPPKLRAQLMGAKKKCEAAQKRQSLSYFLVEFLGTHEFIWVRETDIVEKFDPAEDPNKASVAKGKKRASRSAISSVIGSKTYAMALEECEWATDEFEQVLQEAFDYESEKEADDPGDEEEEFANYSYNILNQSDEEAEAQDAHAYNYDEKTMSMDDLEEANWLLAHEGKADTSADARKQAKKRAQALKKKKVAEKEKKEAALLTQRKEKKKKLDAKLKEREALKEEKELDKRRKKRSREREKALNSKKSKKKRLSLPPVSEEEQERGLGYDNKRARASAIVKAFLAKMAQKEEYQGMHLGGTSTIPAATVESSALLSMALAFRVAAGELPEVNEAARGQVGNGKPYELVDTDGPKSHQERSANLQKKAKLIEKEIERIRSNTQRRKELLFMAVTKRQQEDAQIQVDDQLARRNHFKKKKKTPASSASKMTGMTKKPAASPLPILPAISTSAATPQRPVSSTPSMASANSVANQSESGSEAQSGPPMEDDDATDDDDEMSEVASSSVQGGSANGSDSHAKEDQSLGGVDDEAAP